MAEAGFLIDIVRVVGFPAVIFVIWYLYHKSQVKHMMDLLGRLFALTDNCIETIQYNAQVMSRLTEKIDGNQFCPLIRKGEGK